MSLVPPPPTLSRRFELTNTELTITGRTYDLLRPKNIDDLISQEDFDLDERIPYWADCWPSSRVLAERLLREQGQNRRLLELGCGIGLVSLAAAQAGFDVLATDYYAAALEFTSANAARHALDRVDTRLVDWRKLPGDLGRFDIVAASDVLYERQQPALVAAVLARTLSANGLGLLTDPGRRTAGSFVDECAKLELKAERVAMVPAEDARAQLTVSIFEVRHG
ncbi:MAG: class I SAM-dependent methyltransferase [Planctomycetia bacterium]|nr:class I SAM-dependent methyltransferase [Planctomycetia bacterium]